MDDLKSYCTRKIAASWSRMIHPKTHRVCPFYTGILDPSVQYAILYRHIYIYIWHGWFKELLHQENGCVPITYGPFHDPQKKYWTHRSNIQYYTITLNRTLTQMQAWYAMNDGKRYSARKMAASPSRTVPTKTHMVCPIHTRNIGPIGPISSFISSPWIQHLPQNRCDLPWMMTRATALRNWLRLNHLQYISRPTWSLLSTQVVLVQSVEYPVIYHQLQSIPYPKAGLICHD